MFKLPAVCRNVAALRRQCAAAPLAVCRTPASNYVHVPAALASRTVLCRQLSCAASAAPKGKMWTAGRCLDDHVAVFTSLPSILGAYVGPNSLPPQLGESIMVAVNSVNSCP